MYELLTKLRQQATQPYPERMQAALAVLRPNPLPILVEALADADPDLRLLAVEVLAELEPDEEALPALVAALDDPDRLVRIATVEQLVRFGTKAKAVLPALERWLTDEDERFRISAAAAISKIDPDQIDRMLPVLLAGLDSENSFWRGVAAEALGDLGEATAAALPQLRTLLQDDCAGLRCDAAVAIWKITGDPTQAVSTGVDLLAAEDWLDRYLAAEHLGLLGPVAASARPDLERAFDDQDRAVREAAGKAVEQITACTAPES
jgi:HEAT repeat protein